MKYSSVYQIFADANLLLHVGIVLFVVGGFFLIIAGNLKYWKWVNKLAFRTTHLAAIAFIVSESWLGLVCPITTLEMWLRSKAGTSNYSDGFISHWIQRLLYYKAPTWFFTLIYSLFGLAVVIAWYNYPPESKRRRKESNR